MLVEQESLPATNRADQGTYQQLRKKYLENPDYEKVIILVAANESMTLDQLKAEFKIESISEILNDLVALKYILNSNNVYSKNNEINYISIDYNEFGNKFRLECSSNLLMSASKEFGNDAEDYLSSHSVNVAKEDLADYYRGLSDLMSKLSDQTAQRQPQEKDRCVKIITAGLNLKKTGGSND